MLHRICPPRSALPIWPEVPRSHWVWAGVSEERVRGEERRDKGKRRRARESVVNSGFDRYQLVPDTSCKLSTGLDLVGPLKSCPCNYLLSSLPLSLSLSSLINIITAKSHPAEVIAAVTVTLLVVGAIVSLIVLYKRNDRLVLSLSLSLSLFLSLSSSPPPLFSSALC